MMSRDEKLLQLWDVRKGNNDTDSSDDSKSNSSGELRKKKLKLFTALVLPETEASDTPRENGIRSQSVGAAKKRKTKSCKRKSLVQKRSKKGSVEENKKSKINPNNQDVVEFEDLKKFSNSLIDELKVSRENMFVKMKEEMNKLVSSRRVKKRAVLPRKGVKLGLKPQSFSGGESIGENAKNVVVEAKRSDRMLDKANETQDSEKLRQSSKNIMVVSNHLDPVASSAYLTLPSPAPKPQLPNYQNSIGLSTHISTASPRNNNSGSKMDMGRMMDAKSYELPAFLREEHVGGLPGFLGRNCPRVENTGIGFPIPLLHPQKPQRLNQNEQFIGGSQVFSECMLPRRSTVTFIIQSLVEDSHWRDLQTLKIDIFKR